MKSCECCHKFADTIVRLLLSKRVLWTNQAADPLLNRQPDHGHGLQATLPPGCHTTRAAAQAVAFVTNLEYAGSLNDTVDSNDLAQVARINFSRLDLNSFVQIIYKNVFGLSLGALEIVSLIFLEILSSS